MQRINWYEIHTYRNFFRQFPALIKKLVCICMIACCVTSAYAAEKKGVKAMSQNMLTVNGEAIQLKYFQALLHDNAEGLLESRKELRILFSDSPISEDALDGITFLPVMQMARDGKIRGLLFKLDPNNLGEMYVTLLQKPADPQASLMTQTLSSSKKDVIRNFKISNEYISGGIEHHEEGDSFFADMPKMSYAVNFKAPFDNAPKITLDIKGKEAQKSPQAAILFKKGDALEKKDFTALRTLLTDSAYRNSQALLSNPEFQAMLPEIGTEIKKSISNISRLVVRNTRATIIFEGKSWAELVNQGGEWKLEN